MVKIEIGSDVPKDLHQTLAVALAPEVGVAHEGEADHGHRHCVQPAVPQGDIDVPLPPLGHVVADFHGLVEHVQGYLWAAGL